jgi:hypothetical protein
MVHVAPAIFPAVLLGVTGALAANTGTHTLTPNSTAASTVPSTSTGAAAAAGISHHTLYSGDTTVTATATATAVPEHANTNPTPDADIDTDADTDTEEVFDTVQRTIKTCKRGKLRCDCSKSAKEIDEINILRAEKHCSKCVCVNGQRVSGAEGGPAGTGQLVKGVAAAVVGVAGVMALV